MKSYKLWNYQLFTKNSPKYELIPEKNCDKLNKTKDSLVEVVCRVKNN